MSVHEVKKTNNSSGNGLGQFDGSITAKSINALLDVVRIMNELRRRQSEMVVAQVDAGYAVSLAAGKAAKESSLKQAEEMGYSAMQSFTGAGATVAGVVAQGGCQYKANAEAGKLNESAGKAVADKNDWNSQAAKNKTTYARPTGDLSLSSTSETASEEAFVQQAHIDDSETLTVGDKSMNRADVIKMATRDDAVVGAKIADEKANTDYKLASSVHTNWSNYGQVLQQTSSAGKDGLSGTYELKKKDAEKEKADWEAQRAYTNAAQGQLQSGEQESRGEYNRVAQAQSDLLAAMKEILRNNEIRG